MDKHYHNCPYCKKTFDCDDTCYSARVTNRICPSCRAIYEQQMAAIKKRGKEWHTDRPF